MSAFYLDTSCFLKLLHEEDGSAALDQYLAAHARATMASSVILEIEFHSALRRRRIEGRMAKSDEEKIGLLWTAFLQTGSLWPLSADVRLAAVRLLKEERLTGMVRSLDAIHLATHAVLLQTHPDSIFLTSDRKLRDAARAMGFAYFDPTE